MENEKSKQKFYDTTWFVVCMLIIFIPYGTVLMWVDKKFSKLTRVIISMLVIPVMIFQYLIFISTLQTLSGQSPANEPTQITSADYNSYETGITYNQLARTPDEYKGKKVKFSGKVVQVMEDTNETTIRLAVDNNNNNIALVTYRNTLTKTRILENDSVMIRGISKGITSYKSTMGAKISIPALKADEITLTNQEVKK